MVEFPKTLKAYRSRFTVYHLEEMTEKRHAVFIPLLYRQEAPRPRTIFVARKPVIIDLKKYITGVTSSNTLYVAAHDEPWHSLEDIYKTDFYPLWSYNHFNDDGSVCLGHDARATMEGFWMSSFKRELAVVETDGLPRYSHNTFPFKNNKPFVIQELPND